MPVANANPLLQRVVTAALLVPLVVVAILMLDSRYFALFLVPVTLIAAWEWAGLSGFQAPGRAVYTVLVAVLAGVLAAALFTDWSLTPLLWLAVPYWVWAASVVLRYPRTTLGPEQPWWLALLGLPPLLLAWLGLVQLHRVPEHGPSWVLGLMLLIWTADSAAFFAGRRWGRHRLAPAVSPGKSWEGLWGAMLAVLAGMLVLAWWLRADLATAAFLVVLGLVIVKVSVIGDLFESVLKRRRGVKDSGRLLPGHGGMLDRIDSLTAAAPLFALALLLWFGDAGLAGASG